MSKKDLVDKIEAALVTAHRKRPEIEPGNGWHNQVMAKVRQEGRRQTIDRGFEPPQRFVWRFAAVTCTLAAALALYALQSGIGLDQLALHLLIDDPLALQAISLFTL
jgi:hypothetical protein